MTHPSHSSQAIDGGWSDFIRGSVPGHAVQIYSDLSELAGSVSSYLAAGFELGEPAVVVAGPEHLAQFTAALAAAGWDDARIESAGLLAHADAGETLEAIMDGGDAPSAQAFGSVLETLLDRFPGTRVRAFCELVDLFSRRGRQDAAIALEELWNELGRRRDFSLLCGCHLDVFDLESQAGTLPDVCRTHSHVLPVLDPARLQRAVDEALEEVLGAVEAAKVYVLVGQQVRAHRVPMAQVLLMWISGNMPARAERILAVARARYAAEPAAA
jgi:hypothetical protein